MSIEFIWIGGALLLLFAGAEALVRGGASLGVRAGLTPMFTGLTIVAFGTSTPELVVSVEAAMRGVGDIALGNVVGSNSFNIGIILGLTALVCPTPVNEQMLRFNVPIAIGVAGALWLYLLAGGGLGRGIGAVLVIGLFVYIVANVVLARRDRVAGVTIDENGVSLSRSWALDVAMVVGGLVVLVMGSRLLVENAISIATRIGVDDAVIGLTIIAAGTSLPELATSLVAAIRRQPDIAIGNVIGSNIFNILGILGVTALVSPFTAPDISSFDLAIMCVFSLLLLPLLYTQRRLIRAEGALLVFLYAGYVYLLWPR